MPEEALVIITYAVIAAILVIIVGYLHDKTDHWFQDEEAVIGTIGALFWPVGLPAALIVGFGVGAFKMGTWLPKLWTKILIRYYRWKHGVS